jgi:CBS domain-containing protein
MVKDPFFAYITDSLHNALVRLSSNELKEMPVLSNEDNRVLGIVTISDLVILYDKEVEKVMKIKKDNHYTFSSVVDDDTSSVDTNPNKNLKKR